MEDLRVVTPRRLMGVLRAAASPFPEVGCQGLDEEDRQRQTGHLWKDPKAKCCGAPGGVASVTQAAARREGGCSACRTAASSCSVSVHNLLLLLELKPWADGSYTPVRHSAKLKAGEIMALLARFGNYPTENI